MARATTELDCARVFREKEQVRESVRSAETLMQELGQPGSFPRQPRQACVAGSKTSMGRVRGGGAPTRPKVGALAALFLSTGSPLTKASPLWRPGRAMSPSLVAQTTFSMDMFKTFFPSILLRCCSLWAAALCVSLRSSPLTSRSPPSSLSVDDPPASGVGARANFLFLKISSEFLRFFRRTQKFQVSKCSSLKKFSRFGITGATLLRPPSSWRPRRPRPLRRCMPSLGPSAARPRCAGTSTGTSETPP